jgi:glutamine synthetase
MESGGQSFLPRDFPGIRRGLPGARGAQGRAMNRSKKKIAKARVVEPQSEESSLLRWLKDRRITEVECLVPDMTGMARGKIIPAAKFSHDYGTRLPEGIFVTTVTGDYPDEYYELVAPSDSDMVLRPDP